MGITEKIFLNRSIAFLPKYTLFFSKSSHFYLQFTKLPTKDCIHYSKSLSQWVPDEWRVVWKRRLRALWWIGMLLSRWSCRSLLSNRWGTWILQTEDILRPRGAVNVMISNSFVVLNRWNVYIFLLNCSKWSPGNLDRVHKVVMLHVHKLAKINKTEMHVNRPVRGDGLWPILLAWINFQHG